MSKRLWLWVAAGLLLSIVLVACGKENGLPAEATYEQITPAEAKGLMDSEEGYVILDVRTPEEFAAGHIAGAILLPDYEIGKKAESILTDKEQLILVYCRSGRRSKNAASELATLGYTNIKEFGGINDWKYGTVTE
ncbi:MAG: rhodanese-like domain-containing protein [Clostridia bacterium]|nr:rhodanese-like domain-containing protein [Clostridia bacterium]